MSFRRKIFLASFMAALATVSTSTALVSWSVRRDLVQRLERGLVAEARLAAALLSHHASVDDAALDAEADDIGRRIAARVTLIAANGRVVGDSERDGADLAAMENHGGRPEVLEAMRSGSAVTTRHSTTVQTDMLYVAVPVPSRGARVSVVRLAIPLDEVEQQLSTVRRMSVLALVAGILTAAALAWWMSALVSRRVSAIAETAERYARGDYSRTPAEYGTDEVGTVSRVLDQSVQDLGSRLSELARDRALMAGILAGMAEGVIVVDARGQLQLVNDAARRMLGLEQRGHGRHYLEAVRHPGIAGQLGAALAGTMPEPVEVTLPSAGDDRTFIARATGVTAPGGPIAVVVLHDVSDLKRADRMRREFVANVSHELRTPLTAVRGYVEALAESEDDPAQTRKFLDVIARQSARMERLVQDLLRLARIEAGQERVERVRVPAAALLSEVESALAPLLRQRGQSIAQEVPAGLTALVDVAKIHDVLRNLVENASHYSPEGTTIALKARQEDAGLVLEVEDQGPGIPEADLPRIFERFYRVDKARARGRERSGGTGLGLAIVKHLVGLHAGTVTARNGEHGGAVFTVTIPQ